MNKTVSRKYHLFDAHDKVIGRLATEIVKVLRGKDKADFTPHMDRGDFVVVTNSDKVKVLGSKTENKVYHRFSGYPGGITTTKLKDRLEKDSREIIKGAVYGMMPKNKLRDKMMTRLKIYKDEKMEHKIDVKH